MADDDREFTIGSETFWAVLPQPATPGPGHVVWKSMDMVARYQDMVGRHQPSTIVELGIHKGGSTIMLAEMAEPARLVALELETQPVDCLDTYIAASGRPVSAHYGVDQADRGRLRSICTDAFGTTPIDLVVDDASHEYEPSVASFETLFPLVRPGGLYVLEDWQSHHQVADAFVAAIRNPPPEQKAAVDAYIAELSSTVQPPVTPMSLLALQLVLARASAEEAVARVEVDEYWVTVHRGPAPLDPGTFRLGSIAPDHFGLLTKR